MLSFTNHWSQSYIGFQWCIQFYFHYNRPKLKETPFTFHKNYFSSCFRKLNKILVILTFNILQYFFLNGRKPKWLECGTFIIYYMTGLPKRGLRGVMSAGSFYAKEKSNFQRYSISIMLHYKGFLFSFFNIDSLRMICLFYVHST